MLINNNQNNLLKVISSRERSKTISCLSLWATARRISAPKHVLADFRWDSPHGRSVWGGNIGQFVRGNCVQSSNSHYLAHLNWDCQGFRFTRVIKDNQEENVLRYSLLEISQCSEICTPSPLYMRITQFICKKTYSRRWFCARLIFACRLFFPINNVLDRRGSRQIRAIVVRRVEFIDVL